MKKPLMLAATCLPLLAACDRQPASPSGDTTAAPSLGETVATVNGKPIYKAELDNLVGEITQRGMAGEVPRERLLDELISRELLRQEAENSKIDSTPETAARLAGIRRAILSQAAAQNYLQTHPIADEALKQEYDQRVAANQETEYKARHILVKTEDEAKDIIAKLNAGGKFEDLAKAKSTDGSAKEGGNLGWFGAQQMVEPFAQAVIALENGKYTATPVQTQFGWHVILREDSRSKAAPAFEAVKEQLRHMVQAQTMQKHIDELRTAAQIVKTLPPAPPPAPPANVPVQPGAPSESQSLEAGVPAAKAPEPAAEPAK
jgi:peptidyl-prolyl cis-trans isomerase C